MNAVAKPAEAQSREVVPLTTGGQVAPIIPHSVEEMFRLANAMHASGLVPQTLDSKEKVLVAILAGAELGMPPNQAVQSFYVVNKRPTLWGDAIPALLWAHGFKLKEWFDKEESPTVAYCRITRPDGEVIERTYSVEDARKAGLIGKTGPWQTNQKRMLQMRARAFAARDGAADALKGFRVREEEEDIPLRDVTPQKSGLAARLPGSASGPGFSQAHVDAHTGGGETHDPETGEVHEQTVEDLSLKTGAQLLDEKQAAVGAETSPGPDTADEPENAAQDVEFEPVTGEGEEIFPGDLPPTGAAAEPSEPASDGGDGFGAGDKDEDPIAWKAAAERYVEACAKRADLKALNKQWQQEGKFDALLRASKADHDDLVRQMRERDAELQKEEARG